MFQPDQESEQLFEALTPFKIIISMNWFCFMSMIKKRNIILILTIAPKRFVDVETGGTYGFICPETSQANYEAAIAIVFQGLTH